MDVESHSAGFGKESESAVGSSRVDLNGYTGRKDNLTIVLPHGWVLDPFWDQGLFPSGIARTREHYCSVEYLSYKGKGKK